MKFHPKPNSKKIQTVNTLTDFDQRIYLHYIIKKKIYQEIQESFFTNNDIREIFMLLKSNNSCLTNELLFNELNKKGIDITVNHFNQIMNDIAYLNYCENPGEFYLSIKFEKDYKFYLFKHQINKNIDKARNYQEDIDDIDALLENNNIEDPFKKTNQINKDEYGKVIYKSLSDASIKDFHNSLSKSPVQEVINYTYSIFNPEIRYEKKHYLLYPLIKEGQLGIIFGKSGEGKSIFSMEIANFIAKGSSDWQDFQVETEPQNVAYIDFELSASSLSSRYKKGKFHENLKIVNVSNYEFNSLVGYGNKIEARIKRSLDYIEVIAEKTNSKILFVDNLSNIADSVEQASDADRFISDLYGRLKAKGLTVIFLGHTPKVSCNSPLTMNSLKGSSSLAKTFEVMIGFQRSSYDKNLSYIKQIKTRDVDFVHDETNIAKFIFNSNGSYGWELTYSGTDEETKLIDARQTNTGRPVKHDHDKKIRILYSLNMEMNKPSEIQKEYNISSRSYYRILKEYEDNFNHLKDEYEAYVANMNNDIF